MLGTAVQKVASVYGKVRCKKKKKLTPKCELSLPENHEEKERKKNTRTPPANATQTTQRTILDFSQHPDAPLR